MLERKVLSRINETGQNDKFKLSSCELEPPDFIYMGGLYEAISLIIPKDYHILDLGCYMAAQSFLFENFKEYIGVDIYDYETFESEYYIPPERFITDNSIHYSMSIEDFLDKGIIEDNDNLYVVMNAVPCKEEVTQRVLSKYRNVVIEYPGNKGIYKGKYSEEIERLSKILKDSEKIYTTSYYDKNPDIKKDYEEKLHIAKEEINKYIKEEEEEYEY